MLNIQNTPTSISSQCKLDMHMLCFGMFIYYTNTANSALKGT